MHSRVSRLALVVTAVAGLLSPTTTLAADADEWQPVLSLIEKIKAEPAVGPRTEQAAELADLVQARSGRMAPQSVVRALADLMTDRHDSVRYWAATALGFLGPQAVETIPALQRALKEIERHPAAKTSESAIRLALKRINATK